MEDVKIDPTSEGSVSEHDQTHAQDDTAEGDHPAQAGDKTDPNLLLKSLQEERERRRLAEVKVQELEDSIASVSADDEGIDSLKIELAEVKRKQQRSEVLESYPQMKEVWSDFEEFRTDPENKGMNMRTAAKAFLAEKGLLENSVARPGLERQTGGQRVPLSTGMSADDIKNLRENNYRKYLDMLRKGQIKVPE